MGGINWSYVGLGVLAVLTAAWAWRLIGRRPGPIAIVVSLALLICAGVNAAAPFRGALDPNYVGYGFGYLHADKGLGVTAVAGSVLALAVIGCFAALETGRAAMAMTAAVCAAFAINVGGPWLKGALTDPASNAIEFGEYLTIPGSVGTALIFVLFVLPFLLGVVWAGRRSLSAA